MGGAHQTKVAASAIRYSVVIPGCGPAEVVAPIRLFECDWVEIVGRAGYFQVTKIDGPTLVLAKGTPPEKVATTSLRPLR